MSPYNFFHEFLADFMLVWRFLVIFLFFPPRSDFVLLGFIRMGLQPQLGSQWNRDELKDYKLQS